MDGADQGVAIVEFGLESGCTDDRVGGVVVTVAGAGAAANLEGWVLVSVG